MEFVGGAWLELGYEMKVEVAGIGGFGVYKQASTANVVGEFNEAGKDVLEHSGAKTCTLVVEVYAEASQQSDWLGIAAGTLAHPVGGRRCVQLGHTPRVIGNDLVAAVLGDDEDSRRAGPCRLPRVPA